MLDTASTNPSDRRLRDSCRVDLRLPPSSAQFDPEGIQIQVRSQGTLDTPASRIRNVRTCTDRNCEGRVDPRNRGRFQRGLLTLLADRSTSSCLYLSGESPGIESVGRIVLVLDPLHQVERTTDVAKHIHRTLHAQVAFFDHVRCRMFFDLRNNRFG